MELGSLGIGSSKKLTSEKNNLEKFTGLSPIRILCNQDELIDDLSIYNFG